MKMAALSLSAKREGVGILFLLLLTSSAFSENDSLKPSYQIRKVATLPLDFGKEKVSGPTDFRVGSSGQAYFLNYSSGKLFFFDSNGRLARRVAVGSSLYPAETGFAIGPEGDLYVLDSRGGFIYRFDAGLDLIGKLRLVNPENFETVYDFLATSWGDLLLSCGKRPQLWRLEPVGKSFSFKEIETKEPQFYFSLSELPRQKLVAYDYFDQQLVFLDRYGNLVKKVSSGPVVKLGASAAGLIWAGRPEGELTLLDSLGFAIANFTAKQLELGFEKISDFAAVGKKIYLLGGPLDRLEVLELYQAEENSGSKEK